ncbi:MAG: MFS transporter [Woeseiaceae bacterium]
MSTPAADTVRPTLIDRVFGIRGGEFVAVAWSFALFFCVLASYYILRPVRESMGVASGTDTLTWLFLASFVAMCVITPVFGWIVARVPRRTFLPWVYLFFAANMLVFWAAFTIAVDSGRDYVWLGRVFFVWLSVFNLFVVSVFWSYMADIYTREQGRRLFGAISGAGSIGGLVGSGVTTLVVIHIGFQNLFGISLGLLLVAVYCMTRLRSWVETSADVVHREAATSTQPLGGNPFGGATHVAASKYFSSISAASIIASLLGTALYIFTNKLVQEAIPGTNENTQYFSFINFAMLVLAGLGQMFLLRHVVQRFNIGISLAVMPVVSIIGFGLLSQDPTLFAVSLLTIVRRGLGFVFSKPPTDMLYSVVTSEEKYKTKNFIDTTVYRFGDIIGTWTINKLIALGLAIAPISVVMVPFAALWAGISLWLGRDYRARARQLKEAGIK